MKLLLSTLITFALVVNTEMTEKNSNAELNENYVTSIKTNASFELGAPYYLDVDRDGNEDFLFHTVASYEEGEIVTRYMVSGLDNNEVLVAEESVAITEAGEVISDTPAFNNTAWSTQHGEILASTFDGNSISYEGTWSGDRAQYIGYKLVKDGKTFYGYAEVKINPEAEKAEVVGYTVNRVPGEGLTVNI